MHWGRTQLTPVSFYYVQMYIKLTCAVIVMYKFVHIPGSPLCKYVNIYPRPPVCCKYVLYLPATLRVPVLLDDWGTQRSPFKKPQPVFFFKSSDDSNQQPNKIALQFLFRTHGPHCTNVNIYPQPPVASFILVIPSLNLVVSCPYVSYYLYLHTFMLFRSTCSGIFL